MAKYTCCSVEGCTNKGVLVGDKQHFPKGFCSLHYQRFNIHGDPLYKHTARKGCLVEGCTHTGNTAKGYCPVHYYRWRKFGNPLTTQRTLGKD